ncbi:MAG: hypothetical protein AMXMBFR64_00410 [Myxococcales bacterium]
MLSRLVSLVVVLLATTAQGAVLWRSPQIKIDRVDASNPPALRIWATFLDRTQRPVPIDQVEKLVLTAKRDRQRAEPFVTFLTGKTNETKAELKPRLKAERPMGLLVVMPATLSGALDLTTLGESVRNAVSELFRRAIGGSDRANLIWYADDLFTYIPTAGKTTELSNLTHRHRECIRAREDLAERPAPEDPEAEKPEAGKKLVDLGSEACGLVSKHGAIADIVKGLGLPRAFYPNLFGLGDALEMCLKPEHERLRPPVSLDSGTGPGSAVTEALEMLVRSGEGLDGLELVLVTDGRDGYLFRRDDCRTVFQDERCPRTVAPQPAATGKPGKAGKPTRLSDEQVTAVRTCVSANMHALLKKEQEAFVDRARAWLTLARASGIRIHAVGVRTGLEGENELELDRLRVLSQQTGGTWRLAEDANEVYEQVTNLADELAGQYVIDVEDAGIAPGETVELGITATVLDGPTVDAADGFVITAAVVETGAQGLAKRTFERLVDKVGWTWAVVIAIAVAVIVLLIVLLIFYKTIKAIVGKLAKKAKAAAGDAAKKAVGGKK